MKMKYAMCVLIIALTGEVRGQESLTCDAGEFVPAGEMPTDFSIEVSPVPPTISATNPKICANAGGNTSNQTELTASENGAAGSWVITANGNFAKLVDQNPDDNKVMLESIDNGQDDEKIVTVQFTGVSGEIATIPVSVSPRTKLEYMKATDLCEYGGGLNGNVTLSLKYRNGAILLPHVCTGWWKFSNPSISTSQMVFLPTSIPTGLEASTIFQGVAGSSEVRYVDYTTGCVADEYLTITIEALPAPAVSSPVVVCQNAQATALTVNEAGSFKWWSPGGGPFDQAPILSTARVGSTDYKVSKVKTYAAQPTSVSGSASASGYTCFGAQSTINVTVNASPHIYFPYGVVTEKVCSANATYGTEIITGRTTPVGTWAVYQSNTTTPSTISTRVINSPNSGYYNGIIQIGNATATETEDIILISDLSCKSNKITLTTYPKPVMEAVFSGNLKTVCKGDDVAPVSFVSNGTGEARANAYNWQQAGTGFSDVGLADYTSQPPAKTVTDRFTALNGTYTLQRRDIRATPYNSRTGCYGIPVDFSIAVRPQIPTTISVTKPKICANGGGTTSDRTELIASENGAAGSWVITANGNYAALDDDNPNDNIIVLVGKDGGQDEEKAVTVQFTGLIANNCTGVATATVNVIPRMKPVYMKATGLCEYNGGLNGKVTLEVKYSTQQDFLPGATAGLWKFSNPSILENQAVPGAIATSFTEVNGTFQGVAGSSEVRYIDNSTGCAADEHLTINIEALPPAPAVGGPIMVCQNAPAPILTVNETGSFKWWSPAGGPFDQAPILSTTTVGSTGYKVSKVQTYAAKPASVSGSAVAAGYTCFGAQSTINVTVNASPHIYFPYGVVTAKVCSANATYGTEIITGRTTPVGTWAVYQSNTTTPSTISTRVINSPNSGYYNGIIQIGNTTATVTEDIYLISDLSCKSNKITLTTYPKPVMEAVFSGNLKTVCKGDDVAPVSFVSNGTGEARANAYNWQQAGTGFSDVGLADYTSQPPAKTVTGRFTALNGTYTLQRRDIRATPYNSRTGCYGIPVDFSIAVRPQIPTTISVTKPKICANGGGTTSDRTELIASENGAAGSWVITANGNYAALDDDNPNDNIVVLVGKDDGQDEVKVVTVQFTSLIANNCTAVATATVNVIPRLKPVYMKATGLCEYNGGLNGSVTLEVKYSTQQDFLPGATAGLWKFSNYSISANQAAPGATATSFTEAKGTFQGVAGSSEVRYIDNSTGCAVDEHLTINIEALSAPTVSSPVMVCQNTPATALTMNEAGSFKWWSDRDVPFDNTPVPSTASAGGIGYKVSKVNTYAAQPTSVSGSARADGYTCISPQSTIQVSINPSPSVYFENYATTKKLCSGVPYEYVIIKNRLGVTSGTWAVCQSNTTNAGTISTRVVNSTRNVYYFGNIQAGNTTATVTEDIFFVSDLSCKSNKLTITTYPNPVMEAVFSGNLKTVCKGDQVASISFVSNGTGEARPDSYIWQQAGAGNYNIGFTDYMSSPARTSTSRFTALNATVALQRRDMRVTPYNSISGCAGTPVDFSIAVRPNIPPVITQAGTKICANAGGTTSNQAPLTASENGVAGSWVITANGNFATLVDDNPIDNKVVLVGKDDGQDEEKAVTVQFTDPNANNCSAVATTTVNVSPRLKPVYMKATGLCEYNGGLNGNVTLEVKYSTQQDFLPGAIGGFWKFSNPAISANQAAPDAKATSFREVNGAFQGVAGSSEVRYIDKSTGCAADEHLTINIEALSAPAVSSPVMICQNAPASSLTVNETGSFKWWSSGVALDNTPVSATTTLGSTDYQVSKVKTYTALATSVSGSAQAAGYTCIGPQSTIRVTVNANPVIQFANGALTRKLCAGAPYEQAIGVNATTANGTWAVFQSNTTNAGTISTRVINSSTQAYYGNIQAGNATTVVAEDIFFTSNLSCKSNKLTISTYPKPVMNPVFSGNLKTVCKGEEVPPVLFVSNGTGEAHADAYAWQQAGTGIYNIGLAEHTAQPPTKTSTDLFTALNATTDLQRRDLKVTPYNSTSGCYGTPVDFAIVVRPNIPPVITAANTKICTNAGGTTSDRTELTTPGNGAAGSWVITANGNFASLVDDNPDDNKVILVGKDDGQDAEKAITIQFTDPNVNNCTTVATTTVNVSPRMKPEYMKASGLCEYNGGINGSVVLEVKYRNQQNFVSGATTGHWKFSNPAISANPAEPPALAFSDTEARGTFQGVAGSSEVRYIDNPTGCAANEFITINIEAIPAPAVTTPLVVCQNASPFTLTVNETGSFKWWSPGSGPDTNVPIPATTTAGSIDYKVSKEKTHNAQPSGVWGSATASGYTCLSPQATISVTVEAIPSIYFAYYALTKKLCTGVLDEQGIGLSCPATNGTWSVWQSNTTNASTISTRVTSSSTNVNRGDIQAGNVTAAVTEDIFFTTGSSCKSNKLTLTTYPKPVMEPVFSGNLKTVNKGDDVAPVSFVSNGTGEAHADTYAWQQEGTNNYNIGLSDHTAQPPTRTATGRFTALNGTRNQQRRDMKVKPYNNTSGCYGTPIDFSIAVMPGPPPTITHPDTKICANAVSSARNKIELTASENGAAGSWVITGNGNYADLVDQYPDDKLVMLVGKDGGQDDEKIVTVQFTSVDGGTATTTVSVSPRPKLEYIKASSLCEYSGGLNGSVTLEVKYSGQPNFATGSPTGHWEFSNPAISANPSNPAEPAALATSATEARGSFQGVAGSSEVRYIDHTTGCAANEYLTTISIEAIPAPTVTSPLEVCQNASATALTVNEAGTFKWWSPGSGPDANAPTPSTATVGNTDYKVSKEKTYNAQASSVAGSATAAGYTCISPQATIHFTVASLPVISFSNSAATMKLCSGALYNDAISLSGAAGGTWAVYQSNTTNAGTISTGVANSTTANRANIQAGNSTAAVAEDIFFTTGSSCQSNKLTITTYPKPVMEAVFSGNLKTVNKGDDVAPVSFVSNGAGEAHADAYAWQQEGSNNYNIGLADYTAQPPTKIATDRFTALNATTATQRRDMKVKPYNNTSGCYGIPIDFSIAVMPGMAATITHLNTKVCANVGGTTGGSARNQIELKASENGAAGSWVITANGNFADLVDQNPADDKVILTGKDDGQDDEKIVTVQFTGVSGGTATTTVSVSPRTKLEYMKATNLCEYNGDINGSVTLEVKYSGQPNFATGSTIGHWEFSNPAISANPAPTALATSATEAKGSFQGVAGSSEVRYIDNTTGCAANEYLTTINIEAIPAPSVTSPLAVCQNTPASALAVNEAGTFKWWSPGSGPDANVPIPSTATVGSTDYKVSKEKTYNAQASSVAGSATAAGYTCLSPQATIRVTVGSPPVISFVNGAATMKLCSGATNNDAISLSGATDGTWAIYQSNTTNTGTISTGVTNSATANRVNIQAGNATASVTEDIFFTSNLSCKSNALTITTYPKPVMEAVVNGNLKTVCKGDEVAAISFISNGTGEAHADAYAWQQEGANNYDIGLADHTVQPPTKTATDRFTALNATTTLQRRDMKVKPYNNTTGCYGTPIDFSIAVRPNIAPVITHLNTKICANEGGTTSNQIPLTASENGTTAASWVIISNENFAYLIDRNLRDDKVVLAGIDDGQDDEKTVTVQFTGMSGCTTTAATTIVVSPRTKLEYMKATNLCEYNGGINGNVALEVKYKGQPNFTLASTTGHWIFSNPAISANPANPQGPAALATSATEAKGTFQGAAGTSEVRYIDNTTGCAADEHLTINIEALSAPAVTSPLAVCQNTSASALTVNEAGTFKWWSPGSGPDANAPIPSTATVGSTDYKVSKEKTYNAQANSVSGSASAAGYTCLSPQATIHVTIGSPPVISFANGAATMKLCSGALYNDAISLSGAVGGTWAVYQSNTTNAGTISTGVANSTTANRANIQAGNATAAVTEDIFFTTGVSCQSNKLTLTTYPKPVMEAVFSGNLKTVNKGDGVAPVSFVSNGTGEAHADAYAWQQEGSNNYNIGLADYTAQPPTKIATDRFTALNATTATQRRDMKVKPYNNTSGCYGIPIDFSIAVMPGMAATITHLNTKICANVGGTTGGSARNQIELKASENGSAGSWVITANGNFADLVDQNPGDDKVMLTGKDDGQDDEKIVTVQFTGVSGGTATTTVSVSPRTKLEYMKATNLCEYNGGLNGSVTLEVKYSGQPNFATGSTTGHWEFSNPAISANPAPTALATSATEAKGTFQGVAGSSEVRYIDNTTGCAANEYLTTINIEAIPAPTVTSPLAICQNTPASALAVNEAGTFKWWSPGSGPDANAPIPSTATVGSTDYKVSKEKTYNAQASSVAGSATAAGYTCISPQATIRVTVGSPPVISFVNGAATMKLCSGATNNDAISLSGAANGTWAIYQSNTTNAGTISTVVTNSATANRVNIQAGNATASVTEDIFFTSNLSCKSNALTITTYPKPVMEAVVNGNLKTVCKGDEVASVSFVSNGTGDAHADVYAWQQEGTNNYDIGLADHTAQPPIKTATDRFTALNTTTTLQRRDMKVKPYNNTTGCYGTPIDFSIAVRPNIAPVITHQNTKICANEGGANSNQIPLTASENGTTAASWVIIVNENFAYLIDRNLRDDKVVLAGIDDGQDDEKTVTVQFTGVSGCTTTAATTIVVSPRTKLEYMKATNLCEYNGGINGSVALEAKYKGQPNLALASTTGHWIFSNPAISANPANPQGLAALATSATEAKGTFQGAAGTSEVRYIDNTTGCAADEHLTINIEALSAPAVTSPLAVCQNTSASALTVNEAGTFKWWSPGSGPDANAPIPSTATVGSTDYKVSKEKTYNAQANSVSGSASAAGYTCLSPQATIHVTVGSPPVISFANGAATMKLCSGAPYNDAISLSGAAGGTWAVYQSNTTNAGTISTGVANSTTANRANIQAGNATASVTEEIFFISNSNLSCKSNGLTITTYPKPVMDIPNLMTICGNMQVEAFIPPSAGVAEGVPNRFKWKLAPHATNTDLVGLADYDTDWSKESIDNFTSTTSATILKREVQVSARNSISECEADKQTYIIIVRPGLSATYSAYTPICTGTGTDISLTSSVANTTYSWTVNNNSMGAQSQSTPSNVAVIKQTLTNTGSTSATVTYTVTAVAGTCSSTFTIPIEVSHLQGLRPNVTGAGSYCIDPDTKIYQTNFILAPQAADVEWVYTSHASNTAVSGNTQKLTKGHLTEVKDNLLLTGTAPLLVNYEFRPYNGCFGFSSELGVTVYPPPEAATPVGSTMCSSSDRHPVTSNISLTLSTAEVVYTWTADNSGAPGVTGYTQPSRNGVGVPQNPPAAKTGIIADPLSIIPSATAPQTIDYWITPWRSGCAGKAVKGSVVVNPLPMVNALPNRSHCTGAKVFESALDGTNSASEFIWEGGGLVGLPDQPAYASLLSGYTAANVSEQTTAQVKIWAKNSNNCMSPSPTTLTIAVDPMPSLSFGDSRTLCSGRTVATAAATNIKITPSVKGTRYTWKATITDNKKGNGSDIRIVENDTEVALPFEIIVPAEGDLIRKLVATIGSDATVNFKVIPTYGACQGMATNIPVRVMGADLRGYISNNASVICSGSSTNIVVGQAGDGILYSWEGTGNGNIDGISRQEAAVSATSIKDILNLKNGTAGSVTYLVQPSRNDCMGAPLSILVAINPTPEIKVEPETADICSGVKTAITLSVTNMKRPESNDVLYSWHTSDNRAPNNNVGALPGLTPQPDFVQQMLKNESPIDQVVTYTITPYYSPAGGIPCSGKPATSTYRVSSPATAMISNSTPEKICLGDAITLDANIKGANCQWLKNGVAIEGATSDSYAVPADIVSAFSYSVRITNSCGSSISGTRLINVTEDAWFTEGSAAINKSVANVGEVVGFTYTGPPAEYQWDFNDNTFTPAAMTTFHHYFKPGIYYPKLKLLKPGNAICNKTLALPSLEIRGIEYQVTTGEFPVPEGFSVFPIPAHDQLTIISENELQNITLCDLQGRTLKNEEASGRKVTMSIDQFSPGVYFLTLTDSKGVKRVKIGKE